MMNVFAMQQRHPVMVRCMWLLLVSAIQCQEMTTTLSNGKEFPLLGMGVGNLQHDRIVDMIEAGAQVGVRLVDTAHASHNEALVRDAIAKSNGDFHVVTKVWYTHLGYNRTILSVRESLNELTVGDDNQLQSSNNNNIKVHMLLHWPRCRNDIAWMDCEGEEERLPQAVKDAGPPPHLDKENAYLESWRALEDLYDENPAIESIGVSNFHKDDLEKLMEKSRITPHILQENVWAFLFDPHLMKYLKEHAIHFQAYNTMNGFFSRQSETPNAYRALNHVADALQVTPVQLILAWLVQSGVSVVPRTSNVDHLRENVQAERCRTLPPKQADYVKNAIAALLRGWDLNQPLATFVNGHDQPVHLFWNRPDTGEEVLIWESLQPGQSFDANTFTGHTVVVYDESRVKRQEYRISANYQETETIHIEL
jgi:diketogulonate reductase-like aldo/keto reductase